MNAHALAEIRQQLDAALDLAAQGQDAALAEALEETLRRVRSPSADLPQGYLAEVALRAFHSAVFGLADLAALPPALQARAPMVEFFSALVKLRQFTLALANGDLSQALVLKGSMAGALKALQANLRHLTWQAQLIAGGDFSQRVDFMGEFSTAFNTMVAQLDFAYQQLEQRGAELAQSNAELEARNQELDAFAHTVAHDLKNPLSGVLSAVELLEMVCDPASAEEIELVQIIQRSGRKMLSIIRELLVLAGVRQSQEIEYTTLDMAAILAEAQGRLAHVIQEQQAEISLPETWPAARGYAPWVEEIWANYMSNALKYGGRPPRIQVGATAQPDGLIRFWVHDNGKGLGPEGQAMLFKVFKRLEQTKIEGTGLGLSIVKRITEKLGGQAGVDSENVPGRGCVFYFTLPAAQAPSENLSGLGDLTGLK